MAVSIVLPFRPQLRLILPDLTVNHFVLLGGFIYFPDSLQVKVLAFKLFQGDNAIQQLLDDSLILFAQQVPGIGSVLSLLRLLSLPKSFLCIFCGFQLGECSSFLLLLFRIPLDGSQLRHHVTDGSAEVMLRPAAEFSGLRTVVFIQALFGNLNLLCHFAHPHELIRRMRDPLREQLGSHAVQFLVCGINGQTTLIDDAQCAKHALAPQIKVRDICLIPLAQRDGRCPKMVLDVLILIVELPVGHLALIVCRIEGIGKSLVGDLAGLQELVYHAVNHRPHNVPLGISGNSQLITQPPHKPALRPGQIFRRLAVQIIPHLGGLLHIVRL